MFDAAAESPEASARLARAALIEHAVDQLEWLPGHPYVRETQPILAIRGLVAHAEDVRRWALAKLERLIGASRAAAAEFYEELIMTGPQDERAARAGVILAALGSRRPAAGAMLLVHLVQDELAVAPLILTEMVGLGQPMGARALMRHLAEHDTAGLSAVLALCEGAAPESRDGLLRLLE